MFIFIIIQKNVVYVFLCPQLGWKFLSEFNNSAAWSTSLEEYLFTSRRKNNPKERKKNHANKNIWRGDCIIFI